MKIDGIDIFVGFVCLLLLLVLIGQWQESEKKRYCLNKYNGVALKDIPVNKDGCYNFLTK